jgi:hypothetical protein
MSPLLCPPAVGAVGHVESETLTLFYLRRRIHQYRQPEPWKVSGGNTTISAIKPSSIRKTPSALARQAESPGRSNKIGDRGLEVGVGHNAAEAAKSFRAEPALDQ